MKKKLTLYQYKIKNLLLWNNERNHYFRIISRIIKEGLSNFVSNNYTLITYTGDRDKIPFLNMGFINNCLGVILYAICNNMVPVIKVQYFDFQKNNFCNDYIFNDYYLNDDSKAVTNNILNSDLIKVYPNWFTVYDKKEISIWAELYNKFFIYNNTVAKAIQKELNKMHQISRRIAGVCIRGTDYITLKPKGHPKQPSISELLSKTKKVMQKYSIDSVYITSDEKSYVDIFKNEFGSKLYTVEKTYYDNAFYSNDAISHIFQAVSNRQNDRYFRGFEYLISVILLSKCDVLIAGNCGATLSAVIMNNNQYELTHIFNRGFY